MRRYPNLYLAGAPKCGTTSMADYLGQHPDVFAPAVKEPAFLGEDLTRRPDAGREASYLALYAGWGAERYGLDASTAYFFSASAPAEMLARAGEPRVILMLRNPVEAAQSLYFEHVKTGIETLPSFEAALDAESARARAPQAPPVGNAERQLYTRVYALHRNVAHYLEALGSGRVHLVLFDDLARDRAAVFAGVLDFLDLPPLQAAALGVKNRGQRLRSGAMQGFLMRPPDWALGLSKALPRRLRFAIRDRLAALNRAEGGNPPLHPETRRRLVAAFRPEVEKLAALMDRDLSHWLDAGG